MLIALVSNLAPSTGIISAWPLDRTDWLRELLPTCDPSADLLLPHVSAKMPPVLHLTAGLLLPPHLFAELLSEDLPSAEPRAGDGTLVDAVLPAEYIPDVEPPDELFPYVDPPDELFPDEITTSA